MNAPKNPLGLGGPAPSETAGKDKVSTLRNTIDQIEKQFGRGSIMRLGSNAHVDVQVIPTGSISLDWALGIGGMPRGRVVEVFGPESSGKTTLALSVVANAQKLGGWAAYVDAEHALDKDDSGEQALEITEMLITSGALDVLVIDSVAALVPRAELEGEMGDSHVGLQARLMSQALRKLTGVVSRSNTCLIFINQLREKVGVMFGNPETTTGGRALGSRTKVKVVKNKLAAPFRQVEFDIMFGEGISREGDLLDLGMAHKVVAKSGAWLSYGETRLGQGRENARQTLKDNPDVAREIEVKLRDILGLAKKAEGAGAGGGGAEAAAKVDARTDARSEAAAEAPRGTAKAAPVAAEAPRRRPGAGA